MSFTSLLFPGTDAQTEEIEVPDYFRDLNLDQVVAGATKGKGTYDLLPFFYRRLQKRDDILYRQEVMRDLEGPLGARIRGFAGEIERIRRQLRAAREGYYRLNKQSWFLTAAATYSRAIAQLLSDLQRGRPASRGFGGLRDYLERYVASEPFQTLVADTERVETVLGSVRYCVRIRDDVVRVSAYGDEADYSSEVDATFAKFRQGATNDYRNKYSELTGANHIEAQIAELVAKLNPEIFKEFDDYCAMHTDFLDPTIDRFDREVQFYLAYLAYIEPLRRAGLPFCYPAVDRQTKKVHAADTFDLALAARQVDENGELVLNDFRLYGGERVLVISGPNQGGKTTFARTLGQLHHLASLGFPVAGSTAQLFLCDQIFTHFEREERIEDLRGKLHDDVLRIHRILAAATGNSLVIMNEIFASTALADAVFLATAVMERILDLECLGVCVSFLDELGRMSPAVVSMVSSVVPEDPARRTFKLIRRPADGRAYAMAIAEKYRLDSRSIRERLAR
ncbi:MAG TPA: DNA mismatch repair protein MutS [Xanthobacteraceae bacterium]|jgi:hypothetical protein